MAQTGAVQTSSATTVPPTATAAHTASQQNVMLAQSPSFVYFDVSVNGRFVPALFDSGSTINIMSSQMAQQLKLHICRNFTLPIDTVSGHSRTDGRVDTQLTIGKMTMPVAIHIINDFPHELLIGSPEAKKFRLTVDMETSTVSQRVDEEVAIVNLTESSSIPFLQASHPIYARNRSEVGRIKGTAGARDDELLSSSSE
ncbi:hypothetical protein B4U80_14889 [Leptotrombidium deliense]|uniref:Uncharacterized protein n=1 Tax=Leptotrombidium deliense TaxID=299467 RepID=A0A443S5Z4_9ACAR|nr:hypothetical protein B4U80_14889 [Leptotrombidium deliense]